MTRIARFALGVSFCVLAVGAALAQEAPPPPADVDHVERVTGTRPGAMPREGVKVVRPGALLFASFDANHDGRITRAEIEAGAALAFVIADKNKDGQLSGFEQSDWATLVGAAGEVLSNPMQFDTDLDRMVTKAEFVAGMWRLAQTLMPKGQTELAYADLILPLQQSKDVQADRGQGGPRG